LRNIKPYILKYIKVSTIAVLLGLVYSLGGVIRLDYKAQNEIDTFIKRAQFEYTEERNTPNGIETRNYYTVSRETFELEDARNIFTDESKNTLGKEGDIFVTQQSPFPNVPLIHQWITYYFGGHAALLDSNNRLIEATGIGSSGGSILDIILHPGDEPHDYDVALTKSTNYWLSPTRRSENNVAYPYYGNYNRDEFMLLRVKNISTEQRLGAISYANEMYEKERLYNYTFFLNMRYKYYCTDLISRAYQSVMVETNKQREYATVLNDRFITSVNDLIISEDTYIAAYVKIEGSVVNIYYLKNIEEL
jgi:hypothetical protein